MTTKMQEFMKLYEKTDHDAHGRYKLSHLEVGKFLKCWTTTDKYGNIYYRSLTCAMREHLVEGIDYIIEPKLKKQPGQRIWHMTKEAMFMLATMLRGFKTHRAEMLCNKKLQRDWQSYVLRRFCSANASGPRRLL